MTSKGRADRLVGEDSFTLRWPEKISRLQITKLQMSYVLCAAIAAALPLICRAIARFTISPTIST